jgi:hypothetical protein
MKLNARELQTIEIALRLFLSEWQYDEGEGYEPITEQDITALLSRLNETEPTA